MAAEIIVRVSPLTLYGYSAGQNSFLWLFLYHPVYGLGVNLAREHRFRSTAQFLYLTPLCSYFRWRFSSCPTIKLRRAASYPANPSIQCTTHNQIVPRHKAAKRRRLQRVLGRMIAALWNMNTWVYSCDALGNRALSARANVLYSKLNSNLNTLTHSYPSDSQIRLFRHPGRFALTKPAESFLRK